MSAPIIWIAFPILAAALISLLPRERWVAIAGALAFLGLALLAVFVPTNTALSFFNISLRIAPTLTIFGRAVSIFPADQPVLAMMYGLGAFWFFGALAAGQARRLVPGGMVMLALLTASLTVQPFLYAALLIELVVLLTLPMLILPGAGVGKGVLRFLIYQSLSMPFILLAGFLLTGVEATPGDVALVTRSAWLLGMGMGFLLAVFPFSTWAPRLAEESHPYIFGLLLTMLPTFALLFGLNFLDRYSWLRESPTLPLVLRLVGLLSLVTSGLWAAFQRHAGRIFAYAALAGVGIALLTLSLPGRIAGLQLFFFFIIPRGLALGVWAMALGVFTAQAPGLRFTDLQGLARQYPIATVGLVIANLTLGGLPLLAAFPVYSPLLTALAQALPASALWFALGLIGFAFAALRTLAVLIMAPADIPWASHETWEQRILLGLGILALFLLGIFPQWAQPLLAQVPFLFERLGR